MLAPVSPDNFTRAESDRYFAVVASQGGFGQFEHHRELMPIDHQTVVRANRDTLYSAAVFDLDAGPVTITLPDAGHRFMSLQAIDEDQYVTSVAYGAGTYTFTRGQVGTRYMLAAVRILVDPRRRQDLAEVHALQDAIEVVQPNHGRFEVPEWDPASQNKIRDALLALASTIPDSRQMFGRRDEVEPVRHLIGTASAWGGNPEHDAIYILATPEQNDGTTIHRITLAEVPVDGFWSISVYNADGYFEPNEHDAYTLNSITAERSPDGAVTVQFGGYDGVVPNCLPIMPGWNYTLRLYRPRAELLSGEWPVPQAQAVTPAVERAIDLVVWGTPIVSFGAMREAYFRDAGATYNDVVFWSHPGDANLQITTPNGSSRYVYFNVNTCEGPVVLEIPPSVGAGLYGSVLDAWQVPVADVGAHGEDRGRGGTYLILPPGDHETRVPGAIPVRLATYNGYALLRAIPEGVDDDAVTRALALVHQIRIYPLARASAPPTQRFIDMSGMMFDAIVKFDASFFERLSRILGEEPALARDADRMQALAELDPATAPRDLLAFAARSAYELFMRCAKEEGSIYWPARQWRWPSTVGAATAFTFETEDGLDARSRGLVYFLACAPPAELGKASVYLTVFVDREGRDLLGDHTYCLHVPADVPATQFWAATVYDLATAAFIRSSPRVEVNSYDPRLEINSDGSYNIYFGPQPPAGTAANWVYTRPGTRWFLMFRLYGPTGALFAHHWRLQDLDRDECI
jgi:hypothetical protein